MNTLFHAFLLFFTLAWFSALGAGLVFVALASVR